LWMHTQTNTTNIITDFCSEALPTLPILYVSCRRSERLRCLVNDVFCNFILQVSHEKMRTLVHFRNAFCALAMVAQVSVIQRAACVLAVILGVLGTTVRIVSLTWLVHIAMFARMDFMDLPRTTKTANVSIQSTLECEVVIFFNSMSQMSE
jgi:hypothetical protein